MGGAMPEWLIKFFSSIRSIWSGLSLMRKMIFIGIVGIVFVAFLVLLNLSAQPAQIAILNAAIDDDSLSMRISTALDSENIDYTFGADNRFYARDENTARQARALLIREDLLPGQLDPWNFFTSMDRWTMTDFDRNVNLQQSLTRNMEQHISALEDVDSAKVTLVIPETELFIEDQNPATASVIIQPRPGSDISENRKKVEGIVKLIQFAVEGLDADNITIMDIRGAVLNDFEGLAEIDRLDLANRMLRQKRMLEARYIATIMRSLGNVFTQSRVNIVNFDIDLEFVEKEIETKEHFPITMKEDDPKTPFSEKEVLPSIIRSQEIKNQDFEGTGFNPEGPPGQEGQTPPAYQDLTNLVGRYQSNSDVQNYEINVRNIMEKKAPYQIQRISLGMVIDGTWKIKFDDSNQPVIEANGFREREYTPILPEVLQQAQDVVESAVGYSRARGDVVTVENIPFDRSEQFLAEDLEWIRQKQNEQIILWSIVCVASLIIIILVSKMISRYVEKRRREREEELARQHQAMREQALRSAEQESTEPEMSVHERTRIEMQENAKVMAREHPEDVAMLIKTWLFEE